MLSSTVFADRVDAGRQLAAMLSNYCSSDALVLELPRGGVPVAVEVAQTLLLPLGLMLVRTLGVPGYEEYAMGAIANGNVAVLNEAVVRDLGTPDDAIAKVTQRERHELERRNLEYRAGEAPPDLTDKTVILVDDGIATGADMAAAVGAVKR